MAFWALGALDRVKGITEKLTMKEVGSKLISYVAVQNDSEKHEPFAALAKAKPNEPLPPPTDALTDQQLMQRQLAEYRKLTELQERIVGRWREQQRTALQVRQAHLEQLNQQLIEQEQINRRQAQREALFQQLRSGSRQIVELIEENIRMREELHQQGGDTFRRV